MNRFYHFLTYAGALPFVGCVVFLLFNINELPIIGELIGFETEEILGIYALIIASFLAGAHWGQQFFIEGVWNRALPLISNLIAIILWLGYLSLSLKAMLFLLIATFILLLWIDYRLFKQASLTHNYFKTRCIVTSIVILCLVLSGLKL